MVASLSGVTQTFNFTNVNGVLFFSAFTSTTGLEPWRSDGTPDGTFRFQDINPGAASSSPGSIVEVNGTVYFVADDGIHGNELWFLPLDFEEAGSAQMAMRSAAGPVSLDTWLEESPILDYYVSPVQNHHRFIDASSAVSASWRRTPHPTLKGIRRSPSGRVVATERLAPSPICGVSGTPGRRGFRYGERSDRSRITMGGCDEAVPREDDSEEVPTGAGDVPLPSAQGD